MRRSRRSRARGLACGLLAALLALTGCARRADAPGEALTRREYRALYETLCAAGTGEEDARYPLRPAEGEGALEGAITFSIGACAIYENYYASGFSEDGLCAAEEIAVRFPGEGTLGAEDFLDPGSGTLYHRVAFLTVTVTVRNQDATDPATLLDYGEEGVFDAAALYLVDWENSRTVEGQTVLPTVRPHAFCGLNRTDLGPSLFQLPPGGELTYQVGYFIRRDADWQSLFLTGEARPAADGEIIALSGREQ